MTEPVERRLSPERLSQARRVFTDYWGWHPEAVQRAGNDLLAEVDALRAELDATALDLRSHRAEVETLYGEREQWRAEVRVARAEMDAQRQVIEAAQRLAAIDDLGFVYSLHTQPDPMPIMADLRSKLAALPDDLPAPEA